MEENQNKVTMKTPILIVLILMLISAGFISMAPAQDYTYQLTITSINDEEQNFDLEISSKSVSSSEPVKIVLLNQITPFERNLETGEHVIIVEHLGEQGGILSKVVGIQGGETKGSASSDDKRTFLKAGPGGRYSAGKLFLKMNR